jgi:hypothetical protein
VIQREAKLKQTVGEAPELIRHFCPAIFSGICEILNRSR